MKFLFLMLFVAPAAYSKEPIDRIVATVNNEIVLLSELKNMPARLKKQGAIDETLLLGEAVSTVKESKKNQLNFLIREKLVESEIKRLGMSVSDEQAAADLAQMAKKNQMTSSDFTKYMATQGYEINEYKQILKTRTERQAFFDREIVNKLRITDEDAYGVYQSKFPNSRSGVGEFKIAQIFFSIKKGSATEALNRARAAFDKLTAGETFEALANRYDETPNSNEGGFLGEFKTGEFIPEIEKSIVGLSANSTSEILRGPNGYHIIKLISKKTIPDPQFLKVKEAIKGGLVQQNFERQLKNWFELKKLDANIKIFNEAL